MRIEDFVQKLKSELKTTASSRQSILNFDLNFDDETKVGNPNNHRFDYYVPTKVSICKVEDFDDDAVNVFGQVMYQAAFQVVEKFASQHQSRFVVDMALGFGLDSSKPHDDERTITLMFNIKKH